jgi:hypothetical protein
MSLGQSWLCKPHSLERVFDVYLLLQKDAHPCTAIFGAWTYLLVGEDVPRNVVLVGASDRYGRVDRLARPFPAWLSLLRAAATISPPGQPVHLAIAESLVQQLEEQKRRQGQLYAAIEVHGFFKLPGALKIANDAVVRGAPAEGAPLHGLRLVANGLEVRLSSGTALPRSWPLSAHFTPWLCPSQEPDTSPVARGHAARAKVRTCLGVVFQPHQLCKALSVPALSSC